MISARAEGKGEEEVGGPLLPQGTRKDLIGQGILEHQMA